MSKVCLSALWQSLYVSELPVGRQSQHLSINNILRPSIALLWVTAALPFLWQLPARGDSSVSLPSIHRPSQHHSSEQEQRRIVIESSTHYQFTESVSGIEHRGESQAIQIRRSNPLESPPQNHTDASTDSDNINVNLVPAAQTSRE